MPLTTRTVTIDVLPPGASALINPKLIFAMSQSDAGTDGIAVPDTPVIVELDSAGSGSVDLWTVDLGFRGVHYKVICTGVSPYDGTVHRASLGKIQVVSDADDYILSKMLRDGEVIAGPAFYSQIEESKFLDFISKYGDFKIHYLGALATEPTVDLSGDPLVTGALFFDTTVESLKIYDGSAWNIFVFDPANIAVTGGTLSGLSFVRVEGTSYDPVRLVRYGDNAGAANLYIGKARGSQGSETALQTGDSVANIVANGWNGASLSPVGQVSYSITDDSSGLSSRLGFSLLENGVLSELASLLPSGLFEMKRLSVKSDSFDQITMTREGGVGASNFTFLKHEGTPGSPSDVGDDTKITKFLMRGYAGGDYQTAVEMNFNIGDVTGTDVEGKFDIKVTDPSGDTQTVIDAKHDLVKMPAITGQFGIMWHGGDKTGATSSSVALEDAIDFAIANNGPVELPPGDFLLDSAVSKILNGPAKRFGIEGAGPEMSRFIVTNNTGGILFDVTATADKSESVHFRDFGLISQSSGGTGLRFLQQRGGNQRRRNLIAENLQSFSDDQTNDYFSVVYDFDGAWRPLITNVNWTGAITGWDHTAAHRALDTTKAINLDNCYEPIVEYCNIFGASRALSMEDTGGGNESEGGQVYGCRLNIVDVGVWWVRSTREPLLVLDRNHVNYRSFGYYLDGLKNTNITNNLLYQEDLTNQVANVRDFMLKNVSEYSLIGNIHHFDGNDNRICVYVESDTAGEGDNGIIALNRFNGKADEGIRLTAGTTNVTLLGNKYPGTVTTNVNDLGTGNLVLDDLSLGAADSGGTGYKVVRVPN